MTAPDHEVRDVPRTSVRWRVLALVVLLALLAPASWLARRAASKMEFFHLRSVSVEGTRYLTPEAVVARLGLDTMRSVWDDTDPLVERLESMPQVGEVEIRRRLPGTLVVKLRENLPVALATSPRGLEPVDSAGVVLPIDPAKEALDLPIAVQRDAAILSLLGAVRADDPALYRRISEVARDGRDGLLLTLVPLRGSAVAADTSADGESLPGQHVVQSSRALRVRAPLGVSVSRLTDIFPVESDLLRRRANVAELDLRYRDQVIARLQ